MKKKCLLCDEEFVDILKHVSVRHHILSIENYEKKVKEKKDKNIKIRALFRYIKELTEKLRKGEITPEESRELRAKWEKDNNLIW